MCDRIAFASPPRRNRTAFLMSREKLSKVALLRFAGRFLWSCLRLRIAESGDFLRFLEQFGGVSLRSRLYGGESGKGTLRLRATAGSEF
jgi:hypothetical protein